ncbi:hypothetical protein GCM10011371_13030 [Novosphingobium marinum]|uniref:Uncharacterized protein n=1 Tax=Novosphingobium marinum TaxID=1514948 RepID=A0A7Y9XVK1_9SPHN|nr:hypothetical protein [Novosphingobium marinum]NYH95411.1 hypothetical protein [Novosphingobium marinum]GGC26847.1 hypothetical protein GCM10011371_13030 [Novosphingobium marinum]
MSDKTPKPGWYAVLKGEPIDLALWREALSEPFEPVALEGPNGETLLRCREGHAASEGEEIREHAIERIALVNGALRLAKAARPVEFGGLVRYSEDGRAHHYVWAGPDVIELRAIMMSPTLTVLGPDGTPLPPAEPMPSPAQALLGCADGSDQVADVLYYAGRSDSWFEIYKCIEALRTLAARQGAKLSDLAQQSGVPLNKLQRSANHYRHNNRRDPFKPMPLAEAKSHLVNLARKVLEER